jgi:hypothetical protein
MNRSPLIQLISVAVAFFAHGAFAQNVDQITCWWGDNSPTNYPTVWKIVLWAGDGSTAGINTFNFPASGTVTQNPVNSPAVNAIEIDTATGPANNDSGFLFSVNEGAFAQFNVSATITSGSTTYVNQITRVATVFPNLFWFVDALGGPSNSTNASGETFLKEKFGCAISNTISQ